MEKLMECRFLKIIFGAGGSGGEQTKITLPRKWTRQMGIEKDDREISMKFDGEKIIIEKKRA